MTSTSTGSPSSDKSLRNVAVVARIVHSSQHEAINKYGAGVFIYLVFNGIGIHGNFNDDVEFVWQLIARGHAV